MPSILLPIGSYRRSGTGSVQRLVNVCAEQMPVGGKAPTSLIRSPGVAEHKTVGAGPGRGLGIHQGKLHAVSGTKLYEVPLVGAAGSVTLLGTIPGVNRVTMASNGLSLVVVPNPTAYALTAGVVSQITDVDFTDRGASRVDFVDGYFVFVEPDSGRFFQSDLYALTFDALKFATAEGSPDLLVDLIVNHREVLLLGTHSGELWWNSGANNFVFERVSGGFLEIGMKGGLTKLDNSEFWHANDNTHRRLTGNVAQRVSNHSVEEKLRQYASTAYAFTYTIEGHLTVVYQYPDEATWCFDVTTGEYHERASTGQVDWRVCAAVEIDGLTYVQDKETGKVGILTPETFDEWGETLRGEFTYPTVYDEGRVLFFNRFELILESGVGLVSGQGSAPEVMLEFSDDGGRTWLSVPNRTIGAMGQYKWKVVWDSLGSSTDRVFRVSISDPVRFNVHDTVLDYERGEK